MRLRRSRPIPVVPSSAFAGFRFPPEIIVLAVRSYLRYGLSYRDVEALLGERGIEVDHVTIYRWVRRFTPLLADAATACRHTVGDRWYVDETYVKVSGKWSYVYRAVDQHGLKVPKSHRRCFLGAFRDRTRCSLSGLIADVRCLMCPRASKQGEQSVAIAGVALRRRGGIR